MSRRFLPTSFLFGKNKVGAIILIDEDIAGAFIKADRINRFFGTCLRFFSRVSSPLLSKA